MRKRLLAIFARRKHYLTDMKKTFALFVCAAVMMIAATEAYGQYAGYTGQEQYEGFPKWRVAVQGGFGYRLAKLTKTGNDVIDTHNKSLMMGYTYGADVTYFFGGYGIGAKYSDMHSQRSDAVTAEIDGEYYDGMYTDVVDIRFAGPMVYSRLIGASGNGVFLLGAGLGYLGYTDNARLIQAATLKGGTLGTCIEIGYDYRIMNNIFIGASLGAISGILTSYTMTSEGAAPQKVELDKDQYESLLHANLSLGFRFYL